MAVRDFKKFFKQWGRYVTQPPDEKKAPQKSRDDKYSKGEKTWFRSGDPRHLVGEYPHQTKDKNQKTYVSSAWSDSDEETKIKHV